MKVELRGIIFDAFTVEMINRKDKTEQGKIIDIDHVDKIIDVNEIAYAWGYICKDCFDKYGFKIDDLKENDSLVEIPDMKCYVDSCKGSLGADEFSLSNDEIMELKFIIDKNKAMYDWLTKDIPNMTKEVSDELVVWMEDYQYDFKVINNKIITIDFQEDNREREYDVNPFIEWWGDTIWNKMFIADREVGETWFPFVKSLYSYLGEEPSGGFKEWIEQ